MSSSTNTSTTAAIPRAIRSASTVTSSQVPTGMNTAAAAPMGTITRHSMSLCTDGSSWAVTTTSMRTIMTTVSSGPNRMANTGAISIPEPTPTKPRMKPATMATQTATRNPVLATRSTSAERYISVQKQRSRDVSPVFKNSIRFRRSLGFSSLPAKAINVPGIVPVGSARNSSSFSSDQTNSADFISAL